MTITKKDIYNTLVLEGRKLVVEKGPDYLTARKLSEASGYSVGTIYNQFFNMDNYVIVQNMLTLDDIYSKLHHVQKNGNSYDNLNSCIDAFIQFIYKNSNLWFLLYEFHLKKREERLPEEYARKIISVMRVLFSDFSKINPRIHIKERKVLRKVLWLALFSMSPFLIEDSFESFNNIKRETACKLLLNTYLAGISSLQGEE